VEGFPTPGYRWASIHCCYLFVLSFKDVHTILIECPRYSGANDQALAKKNKIRGLSSSDWKRRQKKAEIFLPARIPTMIQIPMLQLIIAQLLCRSAWLCHRSPRLGVSFYADGRTKLQALSDGSWVGC
jgi:hypothetical protein